MTKEEYQNTLNKQINNADEDASSSALLGVVVGEDRYLIPMIEVSEVIQVPRLAYVPLTQSWFLGLANVRGNLYGITDLGVYLGGDQKPFNLKSRILLASPDNKVIGGFVVNSMLGIRSLSEFKPMKLGKKKLPECITNEYKDTEGRIWLELSLFKLIRDEKFFQIAM